LLPLAPWIDDLMLFKRGAKFFCQLFFLEHDLFLLSPSPSGFQFYPDPFRQPLSTLDHQTQLDIGENDT
jgi:hypothetical protein